MYWRKYHWTSHKRNFVVAKTTNSRFILSADFLTNTRPTADRNDYIYFHMVKAAIVETEVKTFKRIVEVRVVR